MDAHSDDREERRLQGLFEKMRANLLDMTSRNPMLNYKHTATSKRQIQFVDLSIEAVHDALCSGQEIEILPLPERDDTPADERSEDFVATFENARLTDEGHLAAVDRINDMGDQFAAEIALAKAERALKDRLRSELGLRPRAEIEQPTAFDWARENGINPSFLLAPSKAVASPRTIQTMKAQDALEARMAKIVDDARLAEQETGLSTLYIAFGFLEWRDPASGKSALAPLALLPVRAVTLESKKGRRRYAIAAMAEACESNISMIKKAEADFGLRIPPCEPSDDASASIEAYLAEVSEAVSEMAGWSVRRMATLGQFAFGRLAMYADLAGANWEGHPANSELVRAVIRGADEREDAAGITGAEPYDVDEPAVERLAPVLVHDADASQHSAIVDVMKGQNLVIEGPPGTGKSQTITNVIATLLGAGRTVLFLAEKQSALSVVKKRMDSAGLGEFCLELHSSKASPKNVIESLRRRAEMPSGPSASTAADPVWADCRRQVRDYATALNAPGETGSAFTHIWTFLKIRRVLGPSLDSMASASLPPKALDGDGQVEEGALSTYARALAAFEADHGPPGQTPIAKLQFASPGTTSSSLLASDLASLEALDAELGEALAVLPPIIGGPPERAFSAHRFCESVRGIRPDASIVAMLAQTSQQAVDEMLSDYGVITTLGQKASGVEGAEAAGREVRDAASQLAAAAAKASLSESPPGGMRERAVAAAQRRTAQQRAILACAASIRAAGGAMDATVSDAAGYAGIALACARAQPEAIAWASWQPDGASFEAMAGEWRVIVRDEAKWRRRLTDYEAAQWPAARDLAEAANHLAKGFLGQIGGLFDGTAGRAKALCRSLWTDAEHALGAKEVMALARHVRAMAQFNRSEAHKSLCGDAWDGVGTPVAAMAAGQRLRDEIGSAVPPDAPAQAKRLAAGCQGDALAILAGASGHFGEIMQIAGRLPPGESLGAIAADLSRRAADLRAVADCDPDGVLDGFQANPSEIASAIDAAMERGALRAKIGKGPLGLLAEGLMDGSVRIGAVTDARDWIAAVRRDLAGCRIAERLTEPGLEEARGEIEGASRSVAARAEACRDRIAEIESAHCASGFPETPEERREIVSGAMGRIAEIHAFLDLQAGREALERAGLGPFLTAAGKAGLGAGDLPLALRAARSHALAGAIRDASPSLAAATGQRIAGLRGEFAERDRRKIEADRARIRNALLERPIPWGSSHGPKRDWTDMRLLQNEFAKERRHVPIRRLASQAGDAIQALTPCLMMSPLSLAKFMPAGAMRFDVVIVDEASQMRPEDALGGLLRASQLVVVGDSQQLPPTDFFSRSGEASGLSEEEAEEIDHESILEACKKAYRNCRRLLWHYRSHCESLIAFSNREFYENGLITFPRARPDSFSIDLVRAHGHCDAKRNPAEAQQVTEAAAKFMREHADLPQDEIPTLGIVAINADQAELIREEIALMRARDPLLDGYMAKVEAKGEGLFVRNLENVQGDERDHILISMTYGPARGSRTLLQRFGPINTKQGHRRLNVLFSRARIRMAVFASFGSADVRPSETSSRGVHALKAFLEYAESRGRAIGKGTGLPPDSDFEVDVAAGLRAHGYEVDCQVGASGFRIDLGVRNPDAPGAYLAAVECDGATYHSSRSARDRDRLREEVLTQLGWTVLRVWSTDWFRDPDGQMQVLLRRLARLRQEARVPEPTYTFQPDAGGGRSGRAGEDAEEAPPAEAAAPIALEAPAAGGGRPEGPAPKSPAAPETAPEDRANGGILDEIAAAKAGKVGAPAIAALLRRMRDEVIAPAHPQWEPHRSILREGMIETFIAQRLDDPDDWYRKVPQHQRQGTHPVERAAYLDDICEIVSAMGGRP